MELLKYCFFGVLFLCSVTAKSNKRITVPSVGSCRRDFEIDGALVESDKYPSSLYRSSGCIVKFEADEGRLLVNLTDVHISSCSSKLSIYFGKTSSGTPAHVMDCQHSSPGVVESTGKYVTLRLDNGIERPDYFNIILTAFEKNSWDCEFPCLNGYCIDDDLKCDRIDHCADNSDETTNCFIDADFETAAKVGAAVIIGIIIAIIVVCVACCVGIICCCKRRQAFKGRVLRGPASQSTTTTTVPPQPTAQPMMPMQGYQPVQQGAYPPPQPGGYPAQPAPMPQPAPYPQQPMQSNFAPPPYQEKPGPAEGPYPPPPPIQQQFQQSSAPPFVAPSAPPPS